jgi:large subunit ribosomal protein L10
LTREKKEQQVAEWQERLSTVKAAVLTDFRGLNVAQMTELRNKLREQEVGYQVAKNRLLRKAVANIGQQALDEYLVGPTGIAYSYKDSVDPARILKSFAQENAELKLKAGILEGKVIDAKGVERLASLPNREVLMAQLLAGLQSPLVSLLSVLQANLSRLVRVLEAIKQEKQSKE